MRHRNHGKKLGRTHNQRQGLLLGLARSVFYYGSIQTTQAKATSVSPLVEKMCSWAKNDSLVNRRHLFAYFQDQTFVNSLVNTFLKTFSDHQGSYLTTTLVKRRQGDDALIVKLSLALPFNLKPVPVEVVKKEVKKAAKKEIKKDVQPVKKVSKKS